MLRIVIASNVLLIAEWTINVSMLLLGYIGFHLGEPGHYNKATEIKSGGINI
jgi:hypothetical protein